MNIVSPIVVPGLEQYFGGKGGNGTYQTIINHIPPHKIYIEPFIGSGAILRHKKPGGVNFGMDKDPVKIFLNTSHHHFWW